MNYTLIGSGNMATFVAARMQAAGHTCVGAWSRNRQSLDSLCVDYGLPQLTSFEELHDGPDALILAVSDSSIAGIARELQLRTTTLIHMAGSVALNAIALSSPHTAVAWPVYSIRKAALPQHRSFPVVIEGSTPHALSVAREFGKALCDTVYETGPDERRWLHLSAVMGNNFVNHLLGVTTDLCSAHQLPVSLLQPLIEQTVASIRTQQPAAIQTGPARRHDLGTMEIHESMLEDHPDWQALYRAISAAIMARFPLTEGL
jgi:predicted short-subunit dehydrogenase-like oxidoreductase (DUF2520 family)